MNISKISGQGGIYKITNIINGKSYIGRTNCFYRRSHQYIYDFRERRIKHINDHLLNSMVKYGFSNFTFNVIEVCDQDVVQDRELFWMDYYNTCDKNSGYNLRRDICGSMVTHPSTSKKITNRLKKEWRSGVRDGHSDKMKKSWETRSRDCQGKVMSRALTKYSYNIYSEDGTCDTVLYQGLKELKLQNCTATFHKKKCDKIKFKGFIIERVVL